MKGEIIEGFGEGRLLNGEVGKRKRKKRLIGR